METYTFLRELADSWVLVAMFAFLIGAYIWAFLPSQRGARDDASQIPFRNDIAASKPCNGSCETCKSTAMADTMKGLNNV